MDWSSVIVAALALAGTLAGSYGGIRSANKLVNHRLQELERKVDKHNNMVERLARVEIRLDDMEKRLK